MPLITEYSKNLLVEDIKFLLICPNKKIPMEEKWSTGKTAKTIKDVDEINNHINRGGNLGILLTPPYIDFEIEGPTKCGGKEIFDDLANIAATLPPTLTIRTPSGGERRIYRCEEVITKIAGKVIKEEKEYEPIEIRGGLTSKGNNACQSLIYGKVDGQDYTILNDFPIADLNLIELCTAFKKYLPLNNQSEVCENSLYQKKTDLTIDKIIDLSGLTKSGHELQGKHPFHGCKTGINFSVDTQEDIWHCYRCNSGGDALSLLAVKEGILSCIEAQRGALTGDKFKKVLDIAKNKYGTKVLEPDKTFDDELIVNEGKVDFSLIKNSLANTHNHLRLYNKIDAMVGLDGEKYYSVKKWLSYLYESALQPPIQIIVGTAHYDNRTHALIIATAGKGKGVIKNTIKQTLRFEKQDVVEASGIIHPEQLIGKMKEVGRGVNKHKIEAKGYLAAKILLHDEANSTIDETAPNADQSMRIKRTAMDTYGFNLLSKKLVEDFIDDTLEYYPPTNCIDFMHPQQLQSCFFDKGTYRRYACFELSNNKQLDVNESVKSLFDEPTNYEIEKKLLLKIRESNFKIKSNLKLNDNCKKIAAKWIITWNSMLLNHPNSAVRRFGEMTFYSIKEYFFKFIAILHGAHGKEISDPSLTTAACIDTFHFLLETLENYTKFGDIVNTSDVWRGAKGMEIKALEYLYRKEALSLDSSKVTVANFIEVISELFGLQERQAKGILSNLKAKRWVNSKQVGQNDSRVWITFKPELSGVLPSNTTLNELWGETFEGCKECKVYDIEGISQLIKNQYHTLNPIINKIKYNNISNESTNPINCNQPIDAKLITLRDYSGEENLKGINIPCTPCIPESNSNLNIVPKIYNLIDGNLYSGKCLKCGQQKELVAQDATANKVCEECYELQQDSKI